MGSRESDGRHMVTINRYEVRNIALGTTQTIYTDADVHRDLFVSVFDPGTYYVSQPDHTVLTSRGLNVRPRHWFEKRIEDEVRPTVKWISWSLTHKNGDSGMRTFGISELDVINECEKLGVIIVTRHRHTNEPPTAVFQKIEQVTEFLRERYKPAPIDTTHLPEGGTW
jgi:hypothetical protein